MTIHAPMDPHTGLLPCCGIHYLSRLFSGDGSSTDPAEVTCEGEDDAR